MGITQPKEPGQVTSCAVGWMGVGNDVKVRRGNIPWTNHITLRPRMSNVKDPDTSVGVYVNHDGVVQHARHGEASWLVEPNMRNTIDFANERD